MNENAIVRSKVEVGMNVRTLDGKHVGHVTGVRDDTFEIEGGLLLARDYVAPFDEVGAIDAHGVTLTLTTAEFEAARHGHRLGMALSDRAGGAVDNMRALIDEAVHASRRGDVADDGSAQRHR